MTKAKTSDIESGVGFLGGFLSFLMGYVRENKIPFEAIHRLSKEGGRETVRKIVALAYADWRAEQPQPVEQQSQGSDTLPSNHYRVRLTYASMPSLADLKQELGKDNVSVIFDGRPWELHASCVGMDRTPGERIFYVHDVGRDWTREEQIAWGLAQRTAAAPNGYRVATHGEEYEFQKAHPELVDYVALGDSAPSGGEEYVARVWGSGGLRILGSYWFGGGFDAGGRVLFVRK